MTNTCLKQGLWVEGVFGEAFQTEPNGRMNVRNELWRVRANLCIFISCRNISHLHVDPVWEGDSKHRTADRMEKSEKTHFVLFGVIRLFDALHIQQLVICLSTQTSTNLSLNESNSKLFSDTNWDNSYSTVTLLFSLFWSLSSKVELYLVVTAV